MWKVALWHSCPLQLRRRLKQGVRCHIGTPNQVALCALTPFGRCDGRPPDARRPTGPVRPRPARPGEGRGRPFGGLAHRHARRGRQPHRAGRPVAVRAAGDRRSADRGLRLAGSGTKPEPRFVSVPVGEYDHPAWPVNPWARQDADRLAGCFPGRSAVEFASQQQNKFRDLLARLAVRDADKARPLVLHVTALAAVRDRKVYLLPGNARPDDPASWIAVEELLDAFDKAVADRGKLLVLDLAHPTADPFSGVLRDEVSDRLHELLEARVARPPSRSPC